MFYWYCSLNTVILRATDAWLILCTNKMYTYVLKKSYFIFPITKGFGECTDEACRVQYSKMVKNHCSGVCGMTSQLVKMLQSADIMLCFMKIKFPHSSSSISISSSSSSSNSSRVVVGL